MSEGHEDESCQDSRGLSAESGNQRDEESGAKEEDDQIRNVPDKARRVELEEPEVEKL